jgi:DNA-binding transcriptional ArsR family regulator
MDKKILPHNHGENIETVLNKMPDETHFSDASVVFQQLCDSTRLRILWLLCHCEECGINIAAAIGMSTAAVSHHLKSLKLSGLISSRRSGKEVYYKLADTQIANLTHQMIDDFFQIACPNKGIVEHKDCDCC